MATGHDWLVRFLAEFAAMSEPERDAATDALSAQHRHALLALAEAREATTEANLVEVLDAGHAGLEKLYEVADPADLHTAINLTSRERPNLVAEALFAAVVIHRGWAGREPAAISELREQWIWHVRDLIEAARDRDERDA